LSENGYKIDEEKGIVRIDPLTQNNLECNIDERIKIKKIEPVKMESIHLKALQPIPEADDDFLMAGIIDKPVLNGDKTFLPYFNSFFKYQVMRVKPESSNLVTEDTVVTIETYED